MKALVHSQALVYNVEGDGGLQLSTKVLEKEPGDMLKSPQLVYDGAEERAALILHETIVSTAAEERAERTWTAHRYPTGTILEGTPSNNPIQQLTKDPMVSQMM